MLKRVLIAALLVGFLIAECSAQNRYHRRRGAIFGGLAGAAIGAAIGDKGDNETTGALVGGAVGAVAGGAIGNQKDMRIQDQRYHAHQNQMYRQQLHQHQQQSTLQSQQWAQSDWLSHQRAARAVSIGNVVTLVQRGLGEATIIQYIRVNGVKHRLSVDDIIYLHDKGVSEPIINAMQEATVHADPNPVVISTPSVGNDQPRHGPSVIERGTTPVPPGPPVDYLKPYVFPQ